MSKDLKVGFYLRHKEVRRDGSVPIMGRITIGKEMAQFSAKCYVAEKLWDTKSARAIGKSKVATELNQALDRISVAIHTAYKELLDRKDKVTAVEIKNTFQGMASGQITLLQYCDRFYNELSARVGVTLTPRSHYQYLITYKNLKEFLRKRYNLSDISFGALEYSFIEQFDFYLRVEKKLKPNSVVRYVNYFKLTMNRAVQDDVCFFNPFMGFRSEGEVSKPKSLTQEELDKIISTPLDTPSRYLVRDLFLFSAFTGIAFSDVKNLTQRNLVQTESGEWWIHSKRVKTGVEFKVPLLDLPLKIIEKYRGQGEGDRLFRMLSCVKTNIHLKHIARMCGIEQNLTYHQARHSYASLITLSQGVPMETVSKMLGHSTIKSTHIYAKISNEKIDKDMEILAKRIEGKYNLVGLE
ncbi:MAG: site-specific integrase [Rikenellaceae bacterium]